MTRWLVVGLLVGLALGVGGMTLLGDRQRAVWRQRATVAEREIGVVLTQARASRQAAERWRAVADSLRGRRDTVLLTRWRTILDTAYLGADSTLPACQAALQGLRGACKEAVERLGGELATARDEADAYRTTADSLAVSDSLRGVAVDSLRALVRSVPAPAKKWLGVFSPPRVVVGVGCAGGQGFGCGLMAGVGITF